jgi:hypothetical protein
MPDEAGSSSKIADAAVTAAPPYRRFIIGLPLQRSLFNQAAKAATAIAFPGLETERDFPARLDEEGDLFLDRAKVGSLTQALSSWLTAENLDLMQKTHADACAALFRASENAAGSSDLTEAGARKLAEDLGDRLALVLAYGVLTKFVPDVLLRSLADEGDTEPPPFPAKSAGAELMQDTFALYKACYDRGYTPERLQGEWPRVAPEVLQLFTQFCHHQTGFGPLAWDSPGYEDPAYVVRLFHSAFNAVDVEQAGRRLTFSKKPETAPPDKLPPKIAALRRVLGYWLEFLERETWYVRRAFYLGMLPLLQRLAAGFREKIPAFQPVDMLFLEAGELAAGTIDLATIRRRQERYLANSDYLSLHGVERNRLIAMMEKR